MQRVTKMPLLVKRILKDTAEADVDFTDLVEAVHVIEDVLVVINQKCGETAEEIKLEKFHVQLIEDFQSVRFPLIDSLG